MSLRCAPCCSSTTVDVESYEMATIPNKSTVEEIAADGMEILMNVGTAIEASEKGNLF